MCCMMTFLFGICFPSSHNKLLRWCIVLVLKSTTVKLLKAISKPLLPVDPPLHGCRRPRYHRHPLILSPTLATTILPSLSLSGLKALFQLFLPVYSWKSHHGRCSKVGLWQSLSGLKAL